MYCSISRRQTRGPINTNILTEINYWLTSGTITYDRKLSCMSSIQQFLGIHTLVKITTAGNKIVMPQNMLALLPSMNGVGYIVQQCTCAFRTTRRF